MTVPSGRRSIVPMPPGAAATAVHVPVRSVRNSNGSIAGHGERLLLAARQDAWVEKASLVFRFMKRPGEFNGSVPRLQGSIIVHLPGGASAKLSVRPGTHEG